MSAIEFVPILSGMSDAQRDSVLNSLTISLLDFSRHSHLYSRMYGVLTDAVEGGFYNTTTQDADAGNFGKMLINPCVRDGFFAASIGTQYEIERGVGYNLTRRYHREMQAMPHNQVLETLYRGIEAVNKKESWSSIAGYGPFAVDPYCLHNVPVSLVGPHAVAVLDRTFVQNPHNVVVRRESDGSNYGFDKGATAYPKRVGGDWEVAIGRSHQQWQMSDTVSVQHRQFVYLTVAAPDPGDVPAGATLFPVYPGTNQIIPQAAPAVVVGPNIRYTFYIYTLVDPAFTDREINLVNGEFYKLLPEIEFKYRLDVAATATLTRTRQVGEKQYAESVDVDIKIINAMQGAISVHRLTDGECFSSACHYFCDSGDCCGDDFWLPSQTTYTLVFEYITNPEYLMPVYRDQIPQIRLAMMHKIGADLPMKDCGILTEQGFIAEQQGVYGSQYMNVVTGLSVQKTDYGNNYGNRRYEELMATIYNNPHFLLL